MNYFEVFELPPLLGIDTIALERKFHELSRTYHPDYFTAAPRDEKLRALRMTALLNDAYRTLRAPTKRVEYLLSLHGLKTDGSKVPHSLLAEVFAINEQLEEANPANLAELRRQVHAKRERFEKKLDEATRQWDALVSQNASEEQLKTHLAALAEVLSESSYIRNLEDEIEGRQGHYFKGSR
jgi:molecular chaperone HscB